MFVSNIIPVEDVVIRPEIAEIKFECDLEKCKGACCTLESELGAPLLQEEVEKIKKILHRVKKYLPKNKRSDVDENGFYEIKHNELLTRSINNKDCIFVYYDGDIAKCAIEKAYLDGKSDFKKPISCHLFPIRVNDFGGDVLKFEEFSECEHAIKKGKENNTDLVDFCEESLTRKYDKTWFNKLKEIVTK